MKISAIFSFLFAGLLLLSAQTDAEASKRKSLAETLRASVFMTADGKTDSLKVIEEHKATVFIFFSSECPISNSYMPLVSDMSREFAPKNVTFYGVISDPDGKSEPAKKFAAEYEFPCDILMDQKQQLCGMLGAHTTPEVVVISADGRILYQGRIDDRYVGLGKPRAHAEHHDLHDALTNIIDDRKPMNPKTKVIGCWIPKAWK